MKKSELYHLAILAVLKDNISPEDKLSIIDILMADKTLQEWREEQEALNG